MSVTDRDLLEMTAKAVGGEFSPGTTKTRTGETWEEWQWTGPMGVVIDSIVTNPLTNDGDAFRLAMRLHIGVMIRDGHAIALFDHPDGNPWRTVEPCNPIGEQAAARRAIVGAASVIGRDGALPTD